MVCSYQPLLSEGLNIACGEAIVQFADCAAVAAAVRHAVMTAWQPKLSTSLLAEQLAEEQQLTEPGIAASSDIPINKTRLGGDRTASEQHAFREWLGGQASAAHVELRNQPITGAGHGGACSSITTKFSDYCTGSSTSRQPRHAARSGHSLASRLVRYKGGDEGTALPTKMGNGRFTAPEQQGQSALASCNRGGRTTLQRKPWQLQSQTSYEGPSAGLQQERSNSRLTCWSSWNMQHQSGMGRDAEGILALDGLAADVFARLTPSILDRADLTGARALHQVGFKFVPIICGTVLAIVDQHAAGETRTSSPCPGYFVIHPQICLRSVQMSACNWSDCGARF